MLITAVQVLALAQAIDREDSTVPGHGVLKVWNVETLQDGQTIAVELDSARVLLVSQRGQTMVWPPPNK